MNSSHTTLLTGTTSGIGLKLSQKLSIDTNLILHGRDANKMESISRGGKASSMWVQDLIELDTLEESLTNQINKETVDCFIANAALMNLSKFKRIDEETFKNTIKINALSTIQIINTLYKEKNLKYVIIISSLSTHFGFKGNSLYASSKSILDNLEFGFENKDLKFFNLKFGDIIKNDSGLILDNQELTNKLNDRYPLGLLSLDDVYNVIVFFYKNAELLTSGSFDIDRGFLNNMKI